MEDILTRIQNWYKINCDGSWEHSFGFSIATLDNPGWTVRIDLEDTCLENLQYDYQSQNEKKEHNWVTMRTKEKVLEAFCGPENLKDVFTRFLNDIIPNHRDPNFKYKVYLPVSGGPMEIWIPAKARLVDEKSLELIEVPEPDIATVKVRDWVKLTFSKEDLSTFTVAYKKGDVVEVEIEEVADGPILVVKEN